MTIPNQITLFRILLIPLFLYFLLASFLPGSDYIAAVFFLALSMTDALDGYLARKLGQVSDLGKLIDPIADKMLVYGAFLAFIELGKLSTIPVLVIIARDIAVMGIRTWVAQKGTIMPAAEMGKAKTVAQTVAILFLILNWPMQYLIFWLSLVLSLLSGWDYYKSAKGSI